MVFVAHRTRIENLDKWKEAYNSQMEQRKAAGVRTRFRSVLVQLAAVLVPARPAARRPMGRGRRRGTAPSERRLRSPTHRDS